MWWRIKIGSLAVYLVTAKLKSVKISYLHNIMYVWQSLTESPNLNPPIFLQWRFGAHPPNLIPTNISGYMVLWGCGGDLGGRGGGHVTFPMIEPNLPIIVITGGQNDPLYLLSL